MLTFYLLCSIFKMHLASNVYVRFLLGCLQHDMIISDSLVPGSVGRCTPTSSVDTLSTPPTHCSFVVIVLQHIGEMFVVSRPLKLFLSLTRFFPLVYRNLLYAVILHGAYALENTLSWTF